MKRVKFLSLCPLTIMKAQMQTQTLFQSRKKSKKKSWQKQRNKNTFKFIDLFAGIGGFRIALESSGGECVFSSEWDKHSQATYLANFHEVPRGDITQIQESEIPQHDFLCAGFPCQAFSISGKRKGLEDTRGTLFFDIARIAKYAKPKVLLLENVKNFVKHDEGKTLKILEETLREVGYNIFYKVLRSSDYGVPQARERVYIVGFRKDLKVRDFAFPEPTREVRVVADILERDGDLLHHYIERPDVSLTKKDAKPLDSRKPLQIGRISRGGQGERIYSPLAAGITLSAYGGGAASKTGAYLVDGKIRKLSPRECARLQGFPEDYQIPENRNLAYKQFGDSVSVPVLAAIVKQILKVCPNL